MFVTIPRFLDGGPFPGSTRTTASISWQVAPPLSWSLVALTLNL
jgi:hypothetical protein